MSHCMPPFIAMIFFWTGQHYKLSASYPADTQRIAGSMEIDVLTVNLIDVLIVHPDSFQVRSFALHEREVFHLPKVM